MTKEEAEAIKRWTDEGLFVLPFPPEIGPGFDVCKPILTLGNSRPNFCEQFFVWQQYSEDKHIPPSDAPEARVFFEGGYWFFKISTVLFHYGVGDFIRRFDTLAELVPSVLDYYFGDPTPMNPPGLAATEAAAEARQRWWEEEGYPTWKKRYKSQHKEILISPREFAFICTFRNFIRTHRGTSSASHQRQWHLLRFVIYVFHLPLAICGWRVCSFYGDAGRHYIGFTRVIRRRKAEQVED